MDYAQTHSFSHFVHYLSRSRQLHIPLGVRNDSGQYFATRPHRVHSRPNTCRLDKSEIGLETKQACGLGIESEGQRVSNLSMLHKRELGSNFSAAQRCKISNNYLPNRMQEVDKYNSRAFCGIHSADGKCFLTACEDRFLRLYRTHNGDYREFKKILTGDVGWCLDTAFSPDGRHIVYSNWSDNKIYVHPIYGDTNNQETPCLSPLRRRVCIFSLAFSSDGREILGGGEDGFLCVYDRKCQQRVLRVEGQEYDVNSVAFADNTSQIICSAGDDGLCKVTLTFIAQEVWDRRTLSECNPNPVGILAGHMSGITYIDPRGDGRHLLTNSKDQTIKLWDVRAFSGQSVVMNTKKTVANQNWDYRSHRVPNSFYCYKNLDIDTSIMTYRGHSLRQTFIRCRFSPAATTGQRYIYTGCFSGRVVIYDLLTGDIVKTLKGHRSCVRDVSWHPSCQEIVSTSWDGIIGRWRYTGKAVSLDVSDFEGDSDTETTQPQNLRRSARIAARKAKVSTSS